MRIHFRVLAPVPCWWCLLLLGVVIAYAVVLNRRLSALRAAKSEMEELLSDFKQATGKAESGLQALREVAAGSGEALDNRIQRAGGLVEDLTFLVERAEARADRLEAGVPRRRASSAAPDPIGLLDQARSIERPRAAEPSPKPRPVPSPETRPRAVAKPSASRGATLVKALREMR